MEKIEIGENEKKRVNYANSKHEGSKGHNSNSVVLANINDRIFKL